VLLWQPLAQVLLLPVLSLSLLPLLPLLLEHVAALENGLGRRPVRACHGRSIATCSASALVCRSH
jgi:hypothetical protein